MSDHYKSYFGSINADRENRNILPDHVHFDFEGNLKVKRNKTGSQIIVGTTGSGKTALRKFLEQSDKNAIIWNIDVSHSYFNLTADSIKGRSGLIRNSISFILLEALSRDLINNASKFGVVPKEKAALKRVTKKITDIIANIPNAVDLGTPLIKIRPAELFKSSANTYVKYAWDELHSKLLAILEDKRIYVMIDDAENVFPGLEENPKFIEGLARAVQHINELSEEKIHALLYLKYGVFRKWFERQTEYKKVEEEIEQITWNHTALCELIARRIARIHKIKDKDDLKIEELWEKEFEWEKRIGFEGFAREYTQYCVNGPRDMIDLCNKSKMSVKKNKITIEDLNKGLPKYSESKLFGITADFGDIYEGLSNFIESVFQGCKTQLKGTQFADWIEEKAFLSEHLDPYYQQYDWYSSSSKETLTTLMYKIGLLGKRISTDEVEYSMQRPSRTFGELADSQLVIHPAYRACLYIQSSPKRKATKTATSKKE